MCNMKTKINEIRNALGQPQYFKGLQIHPITIEYVNEFYYAIECLTIRKNRLTDFKKIKMSYLEYLLTEIYIEGNKDLENRFKVMLALILKTDMSLNYKIDGGNTSILLNGIEIRANHFEDLRKMIFAQNGYYFDEHLSPDIEKAMSKVDSYHSSQTNSKSASYPRKIIKYHIATGLSYEEISKLTLFQFKAGLDEYNLLSECNSYSIQVTKGKGAKLRHWLEDIPDEIDYSQYFTNAGKTVNKL